MYGDVDAMRWVGDARPLSRERCIEWLAVTCRNYATRGYGMATLLLRDSAEVVGFCGLVHPGGQREAEIKYALRRDFWNQGYASEAARGMLDYGAHKLGLRRVCYGASPIAPALLERALARFERAALGIARHVDRPIAVVDGVNLASPALWYVHVDHLNRPIKMTNAAKASVWDAVWLPPLFCRPSPTGGRRARDQPTGQPGHCIAGISKAVLRDPLPDG